MTNLMSPFGLNTCGYIINHFIGKVKKKYNNLINPLN